MSKKLIKIGLWIILGFVLIQFIPVDKENKPVKKSENFVDIYKTPTQLQISLRNACYDCHSNETIYPDYAMFAPVSWSIKANVNKGRKYLNFSEWGTFNKDIKQSALKNIIIDINDEKMPSKGYMAQHPEANLSKEEKAELVKYFQQILDAKNF